jgi:hypothetical protein
MRVSIPNPRFQLDRSDIGRLRALAAIDTALERWQQVRAIKEADAFAELGPVPRHIIKSARQLDRKDKRGKARRSPLLWRSLVIAGETPVALADYRCRWRADRDPPRALRIDGGAGRLAAAIALAASNLPREANRTLSIITLADVNLTLVRIGGRSPRYLPLVAGLADVSGSKFVRRSHILMRAAGHASR